VQILNAKKHFSLNFFFLFFLDFIYTVPLFTFALIHYPLFWHMGKKSEANSNTATDFKVNDWHTKPIEQVIAELNTSLSDGLTSDEVVLRQGIYGKNELTVTGSATWFKVMLHQLVDIMNWIFVVLSVVSYVFQDYVTGSMLIAVALVNFGLGFSQEYAAEQTLAALRDLSSPRADVIRDGKEQTIASGDLVPGDLILLKEGDSVAADARLVYISNLETDEALLTGESLPVQKQLVVLDKAGKKSTFLQ
jgi:magnesium-transporting ATPase (P-type)